MRRPASRHAAFAAILAATGLVSACGQEGRAPRMADLGEDRTGRSQTTPVHHLKNLDDPYADWFIAEAQGVYLELGRLSQIVECEAQGYVCIAWPFAFSFPEQGPPSMAGWQAGGFTFTARYEVERDFCGRERRVYLIEGADPSGAATRTWYHPDFGIYAILIGQAEEGRMVHIERAYATCERGLYARRPSAADARDAGSR